MQTPVLNTKTQFRSCFLACLWLLCAALGAHAGTVRGVVTNGSSGRPAAGADVILINLQGTMEGVAATTTDAQGRFSLEHAAIGQGPMLLRVPYKGVNFHQPLPPGRPVADVEIFEPTTNPKAFEVVRRVIIVQPNGPSLIVGEEYTLQNNTNPPAAYFKADGNFEFEVPEGAELGQVSAWGSSGMPVTQGTIDKGKNRYAIAFPFRPGQSGIRLAYQVPYATNQTTLPATSPYAAQRVAMIVPPTMQIQAAGFAAAGQDEGWNVFARDAVAANTVLNVAVSGTAPPISAAGEPQTGGGQGGGGSADGVAMSQMPGRLDALKWPLVAGFAALFFLGALYLMRKPIEEPVLATAGAPSAPATGKKARATQAVAEVHQEVNRSMDEIKDTLFRLELRRQAGTISEEEYARERARSEKVLRDFLKG